MRPSPLMSSTCRNPHSAPRAAGAGAGRSRGRRRGRNRLLLPVGRVKCPHARRRRIGWGFQPALRRQDVSALVAVDVAGADAVAVTPGADDALRPHPVLQVVPGQRRVGSAGELRQEVVGLAVVVEIDEEGELCGTDGVDEVFRPRAIARARILHPHDAPREVADLDDVRETVLIDVERQVAEGIDVAVLHRDRPNRPLRPTRRLVPALGRHDVEFAVLVDVGDRRRFRRPAIDEVHRELDVALGGESACQREEEGATKESMSDGACGWVDSCLTANGGIRRDGDYGAPAPFERMAFIRFCCAAV